MFFEKMSEIINKFDIFRDFPLNLKQNIKLFYVSIYKYGYCVLNDNKVYGLGEYIHHILGYNKSEEKYVLINEFNDKNIKEFYKGFNCMFARNDKNEIFSWGWNYCGQLARGFESGDYFKPGKIEFFDGKNIIEINSCSTHCLALSSDGRVFGWSWNREGSLGCGLKTPIEIDFKEKIKFIHCTSHDMSFAVSFGGNAYYWGDIHLFDSRSILSYSLAAIFTPKLIMKNVFRIYYSHEVCIILDNNGNVFEFNPTNEEIIKIKTNEKFIDLYYENYEEKCILQSEHCIYQLNNKILIKTDFIDLFDFCSQKLGYFYKTIHLTKGLLTKEIRFIGEEDNLTLIDKIVFQINYNKFIEVKIVYKREGRQVMEAKHNMNDKSYAIKKVDITGDMDFKEIEILSKLNSEFIVQYIRSWIETKRINSKKYLFIQMELCSNNLRDFIELINETFDGRFKTFHYFISCEIFKELIECVNYLHSLKPPIIHRDLKPANILISDGINGRFLKLCDFGVSKIHEESIHTRMVGTMKYMAPEVLKSRNYNTKSDVYSLALIATEMIQFSDNIENIRSHSNRKDFDKYLSKYLGTNLETKFRQLLENLLNCLLPKGSLFDVILGKVYRLRPDCKQLLDNYKEFSINKNMVLNDENISEFQTFLDNPENISLKKFFSAKLSQ